MILFGCFAFSSLQQTAPPCLTTAVSLLFTSKLVSCTVASIGGTRAQPAICLQLDNSPTDLMGKMTFFLSSDFFFDLPTDVTSDKKKKETDLFSKTGNTSQGSQWSCFLIVSFLGTGPPAMPAGYRWHSPEMRHSHVSDTLAQDCKTKME